jgi:flagellar hook-associated protein 2
MSTSPVTSFVGTSTFSNDLQSALTRALNIAALPTKQLVTQKATTDAQVTELGAISGLLSTLQTALQPLSSGSGTSALATSVSDPTVASASLTGSPLAGSYVIQVLDPGSSSSALSGPAGVTDPSSQSITAATSLTLTVDGTDYTISPSTNSLNALATSINSSGAAVQATIVNLGSPASPDYRLALQSTKLGDVAIQLNDGTDLLGGVTTGTLGSYTVNGLPSGGITTDSRTVTIAPGLNVTLASAGTTTVTVAGSTTAISNALTSFVTAYNAVIAELQKNHGQNGGPLTGDSSVVAVQNVLRQFVNYAGGGSGVTSLAGLGIEFTQQGTLTFDSTKLNNLGDSQIGDIVTFLGDSTSGGFLKAANDTLNQLVDPIDGLVTGEQQSLAAQSTREANAISDAQDRLTQLQTNLEAQMAAADALISSLQQQAQFFEGLFNINTGKNGSNGSSNG